MKKNFSRSVGDFLAGRGFYIALILCLVTIGASGFYLFSLMRNTADPLPTDSLVADEGTVSTLLPDSSLDSSDSDPVSGESSFSNAAEVSASAEMEETVGDADLPVSGSDAIEVIQAAEASASAVLSFEWPVAGEVLAEYSPTLAYSDTMGDWRAHEGIDIVAAEGTQVSAIADGTVSQITQDVLMGTSVTVDHGDGLVSVYANLQEAPTVAVGDPVSCGTLLGGVGSTAGSESALPSHLHLAMYLGEDSVDPLDYLP